MQFSVPGKACASEPIRDGKFPFAWLSNGAAISAVAATFGFWIFVSAFVAVTFAPLLAIITGSFHVAIPGSDETRVGLDAWKSVFVGARAWWAIGNTVFLTVCVQGIALPLGIVIAWLIGRTDVPGRRLFEFGFWISFFLPALAVLQGWILLTDPNYGLLNGWLKAAFGISPFDIYSRGGIIFAHLMTTAISGKVMLMTPAFQNMDARMEEAARVAGDGRFATLIKVTLPLVAPAVVVTAIMATIRTLESFEIELVLGGPHRIEVYSTLIYDLIRNDPVDYASACVLGVVIVCAMILLARASHAVSRKDQYVTITGHARSAQLSLGRWRWPACLFVAATLCSLTLVPITFLFASSVMTVFGFFNVKEVWTTMHWLSVLEDPVFLASLKNTFILSTSAAAFAVCFSTLVAYTIVRSRRAGRALLDLASWLPFTMPGVLFSLAMLWIILNLGLKSLYGSTLSLVITIALATLTVGVQLIKSNLTQIGRELEEASWISGGAHWKTILKIVVPLSFRSIAVVAVMSFIAASRNISHVSLLTSSDNRPMSILQLEYILEGRLEASAVVGFIVVMITIVAAIIARRIGYRLTPGSSH